jgi:hypothetical protein
MLNRIKVVLFGLLICLFLPVFSIQAQEGCGGMIAEDCAVFTQAHLAMRELSSAVFELEMNASMGIEFFPDLITMRLVADGAYQFVEPNVQNEDNPFAGLAGFNADMSVFVDVELSELIGVNDSLTTAFDLRYVDGIGYAELTKVLSTMNNPLLGIDAGGWYSLDIPDILSELVDDVNVPEDVLASVTVLNPLELLSIFSDYDKVSRLDDMVINDQVFAQFETAFTMRELIETYSLSSESMRDQLLELLTTQYGNVYDEAVLQENATFYVSLLEEIEMTLTQSVSLTDGYVHDIGFVVTFTPDDRWVAPTSDPLGLGVLVMANFQFSLNFRYTQFGDVPAIIAPEDATPVRYRDLFGDGDNFSF